MDTAFAAGDEFLLRSARLLERRIFATRFLGRAPAGVVDALRAYQNPDGGFGHALEPDTRCPESLPIYTETALKALAVVGAADAGMLGRACDFLAGAACAAGTAPAVPAASPVIERYPRAAHWTEWAYQPALNPTAGLVGLLYQLGYPHPWRDAAAAWCWGQLEAGHGLEDAHTLWEVLIFLEHVPEQARADEHGERLARGLGTVPMLQLGPQADGYGVSPLLLAPEPGARWRHLFTDEQIEGHLDKLQASQQPDGGWPLNWDPPEGAATSEWRGVVTLEALCSLTAYGRLSGPS